MTLLEKTQKSADNKVLTLYKEGLFYKCYNQDAMVFVNKVKNYNVSSKFIKYIDDTVYSVGFPAGEIAKDTGLDFESISKKLGATHYEVQEKKVVFFLADTSVKDDYANWINDIRPLPKHSIAEEPKSAYQKNPLDTLHGMIENFDLANSTPMQGLIFIQELKNQLKS